MDYKRNRRTLRAFQKPRAIRAIFRLVGALILLFLWLGSTGNPFPVGADLFWFIVFLVTGLWLFVQSFRLGLKAKESGFIYRGFLVTRKIPYEAVREFSSGDGGSILIFDFLFGGWSELFAWPEIIREDGTTVKLQACAMNAISLEIKQEKLNLLFNPIEKTFEDESQFFGDHVPPFQGKWE